MEQKHLQQIIWDNNNGVGVDRDSYGSSPTAVEEVIKNMAVLPALGLAWMSSLLVFADLACLGVSLFQTHMCALIVLFSVSLSLL